MRRSKRGGKTVYLEKVGIWWDEPRGKIHITILDGPPGSHTTVNADPKSVRGNANLFYKLAKCLREVGAPHPPIPD